MKFQEIQKLIQLLADSNVSELNIKEGEFEITIQTDKVTQQVVVSAPSAPAAIPVAAATPSPRQLQRKHLRRKLQQRKKLKKLLQAESNKSLQ